MKRKKTFLKNPLAFFAAGFFVGLFVKFLPLFILIMLFVLAVGGILQCISS